jgi:hypothetical protein
MCSNICSALYYTHMCWFAELKKSVVKKSLSYLVSGTRFQRIFKRHCDPAGRSQLSIVVVAMEQGERDQNKKNSCTVFLLMATCM